MTEQPTVHIIGAGISGLIAARVLEQYGLSPILLEATDRAGGRVKTDIVNGFQLDHGFQVLLANYPAAQHYLDYDALDLQAFQSGACLFVNGQQKFFGDPLREPNMLFPTLLSGVGSIGDKLKVLKLNLQLKKITVQEIFSKPEISTLAYLQAFGFSAGIIDRFFRPFFTGIFLERDLQTSSRMFEFVFKIFGEGPAVLPKGGIEAIPKQLQAQLKASTFKFNTQVKAVKEKTIELVDGSSISTDYTIISTAANQLVPSHPQNPLPWKSCQTLYFTSPKRAYAKPFIGLITRKDQLINNLFFHTSLPTEQQGSGELLSVTVVQEHQLSDKELVARVTKELQQECGIEQVSFLKLYTIPKALPMLRDITYEMPAQATQLTERIFLAGDVLLNGSLNAAMLAGERAAMGVLKRVQLI